MSVVRISRLRTLLIPVLFIPLFSAFPQTSPHHDHETDSRVAVLNDFHEVIFQIWHTAWPEGNVALLSELLPEVRHYTDTVSRVVLPGILRDKQEDWNEGIANLKEVVAEYAAATAPLDSVRLLDAAERLHAQYETMVRIIRPVTKELGQFHEVLYMIYHHYWPEKDMEKLEPAVSSLKEKMAALDKSTLPNRLKKKEKAFNEAKTALAAAVGRLMAADAEGSPEKFGSDLDLLHSKYQMLEQVFE
jgi:hypothetical protein